MQSAITRKIKIGKLTFHSIQHCAHLHIIKMGAKLREGEGLHILGWEKSTPVIALSYKGFKGALNYPLMLGDALGQQCEFLQLGQDVFAMYFWRVNYFQSRLY